MSVGYSETRPGAGQMFANSVVSGLGGAIGQQAGQGISNLVGAGASKLGKAVGLTGPSKEMINFLVSQGMSPQDAQAFGDLDPRAQQQILSNLAAQKQQQKTSDAYGALTGSEGGMPQQGMGAQQQGAQQGQPQQEGMGAEDGEIQPEFMPKPSEMFANARKMGLPANETSAFTKEYKKEYESAMKKADDFITGIKTDAKASKGSNQRLDRMYELVQKGNLAPSTSATIIDTIEKGINGIVNFGVDLHGIMNGDSQEFNKLSKDFIKEAKNYFGSRVTDTDIKLLLKTVPDLAQSDEAKLRVINNLKVMNEAALVKNKAIKAIKSQSGGRIPVNIEELVEERVGDQLDILAEKLKTGESILPDYEAASQGAKQRSKGELPGAAVGGLVGGALGSALGPIGTGLGAVAGSAAGSYIPQALRGAQEGSRKLEEALGVPDVSGGIRNLIGLGPRKR